MSINKYNHIISTTLNFAKRDLKTRYAESVIGSFWIIIYPLAFSIITASIFSIAFKGNFDHVPYFMFVLIGFNSWFWFSQTVVRSTKSLIYNRDTIVNNKFPTESVIFSIVLTSTIDFFINILFTFMLLNIVHVPTTILSICLLVAVSFLQLLFQTGISLIFSALNVYFRDTQNIVDIVLQLVFYLTPIIYSPDSLSNNYAIVIHLNPLTLLINSYRNILLYNKFDSQILTFGIISMTTFYVGYQIYKNMSNKFTELI